MLQPTAVIGCSIVCVAGKCIQLGVDNVGTVPAALSTFLACQHTSPDLIISVGTAGGFKAQGAAIGDVFVGAGTVNHDRRIPIPVSFLHLTPSTTCNPCSASTGMFALYEAQTCS